jgi:hypothetical protein
MRGMSYIKNRIKEVEFELKRVRLQMDVLHHDILGVDRYSTIEDLQNQRRQLMAPMMIGSLGFGMGMAGQASAFHNK